MMPRHVVPQVLEDLLTAQDAHLINLIGTDLNVDHDSASDYLLTLMTRRENRPGVAEAATQAWEQRWLASRGQDEMSIARYAGGIQRIGPAAGRLLPGVLAHPKSHLVPHTVSITLMRVGSAAQITKHLPSLLDHIAPARGPQEEHDLEDHSFLQTAIRMGGFLHERVRADLAPTATRLLARIGALPDRTDMTGKEGAALVGGVLLGAGDHHPRAMVWAHAMAQGSANVIPGRQYPVDPLPLIEWMQVQCDRGHAKAVAVDVVLYGALAKMAIGGTDPSDRILDTDHREQACRLMAQVSAAGGN